MRACCLMLVASFALAAEPDPYTAWSQGRPQEALPLLESAARASGRWDAWLDVGLAAAKAGDRGRAVAAFIAAQRRAPARDEPRQALRALDCTPPEGWLELLGPICAPGLGWIGVALSTLGGLAAGAGLAARRKSTFAIGILLIAGAAPGQIATWHDAHAPWYATLRDTQLADSAGEPLRPVTAGTVVAREGAMMGGRALVRLEGGARGYMPVADLGSD